VVVRPGAEEELAGGRAVGRGCAEPAVRHADGGKQPVVPERAHHDQRGQADPERGDDDTEVVVRHEAATRGRRALWEVGPASDIRRLRVGFPSRQGARAGEGAFTLRVYVWGLEGHPKDREGGRPVDGRGRPFARTCKEVARGWPPAPWVRKSGRGCLG